MRHGQHVAVAVPTANRMDRPFGAEEDKHDPIR